MFVWSIMVLSVVCAGLNNILLRLLANKNIKYSPFLFNAGMMLIWAVILFAVSGIKEITPTTWLFAFLYGIIVCGFIFFKNAALTNGPISITSLIGGSSFVLSTIFNTVYFRDEITIMQVVGMVLIVVSVFMVNFPQKTSEKTTLKWKILCAIFFVFAALVGVIFRFDQVYDKEHTGEMMILASIFAALVMLVIYGIARIKDRNKQPKMEEIQPKSKKNSLILLVFVVLSGIVSCVYNRCNIYLSGAMTTILFSPIFNGSLIMVSFLAGLVLFKEKATVLKIIGFCIGILAIICFSGFFGLVNI